MTVYLPSRVCVLCGIGPVDLLETEAIANVGLIFNCGTINVTKQEN